MLETQRWVNCYQNSITNPVGYYMNREGGPDFLTGPGELLSKTSGQGWRLLSGGRAITSKQDTYNEES